MSPEPEDPDSNTVCGQFCCSDFYKLQDAEHLSTGYDLLTNDIHPVFSHEYWENVTSNDYNSIVSILRLASHLIETDAFAEFIATAVDGDLYIDVDPQPDLECRFVKPKPLRRSSAVVETLETNAIGHNKVFQKDFFGRRFFKTDVPSIYRGLQETGEQCRHFLDRASLLRIPKRGKKICNAAIRDRSRHLLTQMEGMIRFWVAELTSATGTTNGLQALAQGPLPERQDKVFPYGRKSYIVLAVQHMRSMNNAQVAVERGTVEEIELRKWEFAIANTLVHELAHAVSDSVNGPELGGSVAFRDNALVETGFDLISHIYGGNIVETSRGLPVPPGPHMSAGEGSSKKYIMMTEWPSGLTYAYYRDAKHNIARRGRLPNTDTITRVPHEFVMKLFTNLFSWDLAHKGNKGWLRPKGPRWMIQRLVAPPRHRLNLMSLTDKLATEDYRKLMKIVTRQPSVKAALATMGLSEDDAFIMATSEDVWPEDDKEPKIVLDEPPRRSSRILAMGQRTSAAVKRPAQQAAKKTATKRKSSWLESEAKRRRTL